LFFRPELLLQLTYMSLAQSCVVLSAALGLRSMDLVLV
jgi:hypothetical protein